MSACDGRAQARRIVDGVMAAMRPATELGRLRVRQRTPMVRSVVVSRVVYAFRPLNLTQNFADTYQYYLGTGLSLKVLI